MNASEPDHGDHDNPVSAAPPKAHSRKPLWIALAVIVLLVAGGVAVVLTRNLLPVSTPAGATRSTAPAAPTATIPAGFKVYTDTNGRFQFIAPESWTESTKDSLTFLKEPTIPVIVEVGNVGQPLDHAAITSAELAFFNSIAISGDGTGSYTVVENPTPVTLGGETWTQQTADVNVGKEKLRAVMLIANHAGNAYAFAYATTPSAFTQIDSEDFQPMLQSFEFLS